MKMILAIIALFLVAKAYAGASVKQVDCTVARPGYQQYEVNFQFRDNEAQANIQYLGRTRGIFYAQYVDVQAFDNHRYTTLFTNDNKKMTFELPESLFKARHAGRDFQVSINYGEFFAICAGK